MNRGETGPSLVTHISVTEVVRPLRVTFSTSLGRKDQIRSLLVKVRLSGGAEGTGECPTSFTLKQETIPAMRSLIREMAGSLVGRPVESAETAIGDLRQKYSGFPMTVSGLETALFRAHLAHHNVKEDEYWGGKLDSLETDITIPFLPRSAKLDHWLDYAVRQGFRTFKVKVGGDPAEDCAFVTGLRERLKEKGCRFRLRLDGNQGYGIEGFLKMVDTLSFFADEIDLFEQPLPKEDLKGLAEATRRSPIPVILDETVFSAGDAQRAVDSGIGHGFNIKVAKSGIVESRRILAIAKKHGLKLMVGCMMETMTGLSAAIRLAAGTGAFDYVDLDSIFFLHHRKQYQEITIQAPGFNLGKI